MIASVPKKASLGELNTAESPINVVLRQPALAAFFLGNKFDLTHVLNTC